MADVHYPPLHPRVRDVTDRIVERSREARRDYVERMRRAADLPPKRAHLACSNLAHTIAASTAEEKKRISDAGTPNIGIVSAYNDMLSAHQPLVAYPGEIKLAVRQAGAVAQFAGGVPAMCDGVTQGEAGMELSLASRDVIAQAAAVALSHDVFDAGLCLGVCDKIVPGLVIGALAFGHLPFVFVPAGPMPSGLPNDEKRKARQRYAEGKISRRELLMAEAKSYHSPGTCTFFGTANSNQMFMELMGLHLPGASFENPGTPLRKALTAASARRAVELTGRGGRRRALYQMLDERAFVNAVVGLLATGGSTNHTIHLIAMARAAGVAINWRDFDDLSAVVPLLTRVYPNGQGDVNDFHRAGGLAYLIAQLLAGGLVHGDVETVAKGSGLGPYTHVAAIGGDGRLAYAPPISESFDPSILRPIDDPFQPNGGLRLLEGNLGRSVIKVSAVDPERHRIEAPARIFERQEDLLDAFQRGELDGDMVAVVRRQGPRSNGMPELHKLMTPLGSLQSRGFRVALVTDGRLSGASGKVPAAIHLTPEADGGGPIAKVRDGYLILLDATRGVLEARVPDAEWRARDAAPPQDPAAGSFGVGRELFAGYRSLALSAEEGAWSFGEPAPRTSPSSRASG
ncbi:MAG: phosphogluconate dehydratase [Acidobacteriota bacterium]